MLVLSITVIAISASSTLKRVSCQVSADILRLLTAMTQTGAIEGSQLVCAMAQTYARAHTFHEHVEGSEPGPVLLAPAASDGHHSWQ